MLCDDKEYSTKLEVNIEMMQERHSWWMKQKVDQVVYAYKIHFYYLV